MTYEQITKPSVAPVTLSETKMHMRISSGDEDELLSQLIAAATELTERETGIALITQTWRLWLDALPLDGTVSLPKHPVQRIEQITWYDADGAALTLEGESYFLNTVTRPATLKFQRSALPAGFCNGIEIDFTTGFGDIGTDIPDMLRRAILALVAHWYEFRGVYAPADQPVSVPDIYSRLTSHYRQARL